MISQSGCHGRGDRLPLLGVAGVTAGKFTVSYNCFVIKWLQWPINRGDAAGLAVQYGGMPISVGSHIEQNVLFFQM
jgi:hypothetical protein